MASVIIDAALELRDVNRNIVRTSTGVVYVVAFLNGNIRMYKGNAQPPTSFAEQDAGNAPDNPDYEVAACAIDSLDIIHVIYYFFDSAAMGAQPAVRYATFHTVDAASFQDLWQIDAVGVTMTDEATFEPALSIAIDTNDDVHIIFNDKGKNMGTNVDKIFYANNIVSGGSNFSAKVEVFEFTLLNDDITSNSLIIGSPTNAIGADRPILVFVKAPASVDNSISAAHGNALDATAFTFADDITQTIIEIFPNISLTQTTNDDLYVSFVEQTTFDLRVIKREATNPTWSTWVVPPFVVSVVQNYADTSIAANGADIYVIGHGILDLRMFESLGGAAFTEITAGDLPISGFRNNPSLKWAAYANNEESIQLDFIFEDVSNALWNKHVFPAPANNPDGEMVQIIA